MRTRVKICGITSCEDARLVVNAGVDAVGLVFYEKSPRNVSLSLAADISRKIPAFVSRVALFKDAEAAFIESVLQQVEIDLIQFHGSETVEFCEQFSRPYIKALGMKGAQNCAEYLLANAKTFSSAKALLLDSHAPGEAGGSGETFDWSTVADIEKPLVLAGGLTAANVKRAIELVQPFAVDVSSGVEKSPGIKDREQVAKFMQQVSECC